MNLTQLSLSVVPPTPLAVTPWIVYESVDDTEAFEFLMDIILAAAGNYNQTIRQEDLYVLLLDKGRNSFDPIETYRVPLSEEEIRESDLPVNIVSPQCSGWFEMFDLLIECYTFNPVHSYRRFMLEFYTDRMLIVVETRDGGRRIILVTDYAYIRGESKVGEFW